VHYPHPGRRCPVTGMGPRARLTRADERAIAKLLAEGDDNAVLTFSMAIHHYELLASNAKARLAKAKIERPIDEYWRGGYGAAMHTVLDVINEMAERYTDGEVLRAVVEVAYSAGDLAFVEGTAAAWSRSAS
jgi:hypothetical protein